MIYTYCSTSLYQNKLYIITILMTLRRLVYSYTRLFDVLDDNLKMKAQRAKMLVIDQTGRGQQCQRHDIFNGSLDFICRPAGQCH